MKRKLTELFLIDGTPMLDPDAGVEFEYNDMLSSDSGTDEGGFTHNIVLRSEVKTWKFVYSWLTAEEHAYIRALLRGKHDFSFTFKDETGQMQTVKAYCSQKRAAYWSARRGIYKDMQFDIIEC